MEFPVQVFGYATEECRVLYQAIRHTRRPTTQASRKPEQIRIVPSFDDRAQTARTAFSRELGSLLRHRVYPQNSRQVVR